MIASPQMEAAHRRRIRFCANLVFGLLLCCAGVPAPGSAQVPAAITFTIERFAVEGENPLTDRETEKILAPFTGPQQGISGVEDAARALERTLVEQGFAFHRVTVPPQRAAGGVFTLRITTFRVGSVAVSGNAHFSDRAVLNSLPTLAVGEAPNSLRIARSLKQSNEHPARRVAVFLSEAETAGELNARVEVRDAKPWQVFGSLANTGNDETGDSRLSVGFQHSGVFGYDHVLTASYTTSPLHHFDDVTQVGVFYRIPLYRWAGAIEGYFTYSDVDQGTDTTGVSAFDVSGAGRFGGISYTHNLIPIGNFNHSLRLALDDRLFENNTVNLNFPDLTFDDVRTRPLSIQYSGRWEEGKRKLNFYVQAAANLPGGRHNTDSAYEANRCGLDPLGVCNPLIGTGDLVDRNWQAVRIGANTELPLFRDWSFRGRLAAQLASVPLIPGEQFGLGGVNSVRGFSEREISGESGVQLNAEIYFPSMIESLQMLAFLDYGRLQVEDPDDNALDGETVLSYGFGMRWFFRSHVGIALDVAHVLDGNGSTADPAMVEITEAGDTFVHVNLFTRF
jgi:hemolysin activation/secretion protein